MLRLTSAETPDRFGYCWYETLGTWDKDKMNRLIHILWSTYSVSELFKWTS